jgi:hypothetical protein
MCLSRRQRLGPYPYVLEGSHAQIVTPTVESVRAACAGARQFIELHPLCLEATIEDYLGYPFTS